ncbi:hypothetical protein BJX66DRAFT_292585 [Aspergillus keveii]|uniref:Secreted protein n=1 Tax=Aspergillus keveii TaxID=714993 RepID=A0ABR4GL28_9EURO
MPCPLVVLLIPFHVRGFKARRVIRLKSWADELDSLRFEPGAWYSTRFLSQRGLHCDFDGYSRSKVRPACTSNYLCPDCSKREPCATTMTCAAQFSRLTTQVLLGLNETPCAARQLQISANRGCAEAEFVGK